MKRNILIIVVTICTLLCGIFLPGILINHQVKTRYTGKTATTISFNYDITPIMSRNASSRLSTYEKLKLICGLWDSTLTKEEPDAASQSPDEAFSTARQALESLYESGGYPCSIKDRLQKDHSQNATLYKATDTRFFTYSAYYWNFEISLNDTTEKHTIWMTEDGTIFYAATNAAGKVKNLAWALSAPFTQKSFTLQANLTYDNAPKYPQIKLPYRKAKLKDSVLWIIDNSNVRSLNDAKNCYQMNNIDGAVYYAYQLSTPDHYYVYTLIPYRPADGSGND